MANWGATYKQKQWLFCLKKWLLEYNYRLKIVSFGLFEWYLNQLELKYINLRGTLKNKAKIAYQRASFNIYCKMSLFAIRYRLLLNNSKRVFFVWAKRDFDLRAILGWSILHFIENDNWIFILGEESDKSFFCWIMILKWFFQTGSLVTFITLEVDQFMITC